MDEQPVVAKKRLITQNEMATQNFTARAHQQETPASSMTKAYKLIVTPSLNNLEPTLGCYIGFSAALAADHD